MNKRIKVSIIVTLPFLFLIGYFLYQNSKTNPSEIIDVETTKNEVENYIANIQKQEQQVFKLVSDEEVELAYMETHPEEIKYGDKKGVIEFTLAAIMMNDVDLFLQAFDPYVISSDIHSNPEKDKNLVLERFMKQISRDGLLTELGYEEEKGLISSASSIANVTFYYSDGIEVTIPITFTKAETHHNEGEIYTISTSVIEIIQDIESSIK